MNRLHTLLHTLDVSRDPEEVQLAADRYVAEVPDDDLAWGVFLLRGGKLKRQCPTAVLKQWG
ncbi:MAG: ATP-dependent DNA ligase, partial [Ignavibacteria bacterium]|nr:ATP-dependent DNA ligase [Ignavibacteria bacterium]